MAVVRMKELSRKLDKTGALYVPVFLLLTLTIILSSAPKDAGASLPFDLRGEQGKVVEKTLTARGHDGPVELIKYLQYLPENVIVSELPIVVLIHGTASNPVNAAKEYGCDGVAQGKYKTAKIWKEWADKHQVLLICPIFDQLNFGSGEDGAVLGGYRGLLGRHGRGVDDRLSDADMVVNQIVDEYLDHYPSLFQSLILMAGHSAGGMFMSRYVVTHVDRYKAAVISSSGSFAWPDSRPWTNGMGWRHLPKLQWQNPKSQPRNYSWMPVWYKFTEAAEKPIMVSFGRCEVTTELPDDCSCRWKRFFAFKPVSSGTITFHGPEEEPITLFTGEVNNSAFNFKTIWDLKNAINNNVPGIKAKVAGGETLIEMDVDFSYCGKGCYEWEVVGTGAYSGINVDFADNDKPGNEGDACRRSDGDFEPWDPVYEDFNGILGDGLRYVTAMRENAGLAPNGFGIFLNIVPIDDHYPWLGTLDHTAFLQNYLGCRRFTDTVINHVAMGRAYERSIGVYRTVGGDDSLGNNREAYAEIWETEPGIFRASGKCNWPRYPDTSGPGLPSGKASGIEPH